MIKLNLKKFFIQFFILLIIFLIDRITKIYILNIADIFISFGIICLIFAELLNYKKGK